jgi:hypothetical protein
MGTNNMTIEQIKAAETYLDAQRNVLPATVKYNYKKTYNYLFTKMNESNKEKETKTYSIFSLLVYYLKHKKLPN